MLDEKHKKQTSSPKVVYKPRLMCNFSTLWFDLSIQVRLLHEGGLYGAASIEVRRLFEGGLNAKS